MTSTRFLLALALVAVGMADASAAAATDDRAATDGSGERHRFVVRLAEPALASYTDAAQLSAGAPKLAPTSPALSGARGLDLAAKSSRDYLRHLAARQTDLVDRAAGLLGRPLQPLGSYRLVLNAVALELSAKEAARLARLSGVAHVEREWTHRLLTDAGPRWIEADAVWFNGVLPAGTSRGEGVVVGVVDSGVRASHISFAATGGGYTHTNPRGRTYGLCVASPATCNSKLIGLWDMTCQSSQTAPNFSCGVQGSDADDQETNNGLDLDGHGTHVAATAAGNPLTVNFSAGTRSMSGVAPRANLISYKACEEESSCKGLWLLNALEQAAADGVDVINYSLGGSAIDPWYSSAAVAMRGLRAAGTVVVVAAGNEGPGPSTVGSPGNAPWVLTAAASTHDRYLASRVSFAGPAPLPAGGALLGAHYGGSTSLTAELPLGLANPSPCATGSDLGPGGNNLPPAWTPTTYSGSLVGCEGGAYDIGDQSDNVAAAGGAGVLLLNDEAAGVSAPLLAGNVPSVIFSWPNAELLRSWLASGSGHRARIAAPTFVADGSPVADVLAEFSSRGPAYPHSATGALKPDVAAPGVSILAAAEDLDTGLIFRGGTSMASPHVAGAAALLRAARPTWRADQIVSALSGTAQPVVRLQQGDGSTLADPFGQGSGRVDLARALEAGLYFAETEANWTNAHPDLGGDPRQLNRPSLVDPACVSQCSFQRRVTGLRAATWSVQTDLPEGMTATVSPAGFSLAADQTRSLQIDVTLPAAAFGTWLHGTIRLVADDPAIPGVALPLSVFADAGSLPPAIEIDAEGEKGWHLIQLDGLADLPEPVFPATELVAPLRAARRVGQDATRSDPYDNPDQVWVSWIQFSPGGGPGLVEAYAESATADDIDLFVGRDDNGDGIPQAAEERCASTTPDAVEACFVEETDSDPDVRYWILVQNWQGAEATGDGIDLEAAALRLAPTLPVLTAAGPGHVAARTGFPLRLFWDMPDQLPGEARIGYLIGGRTPDTVGSLGATRITIQRAAAGADSAHLLVPGTARSLRLAPGAAHEAIAIEVPTNASRLQVNAADAAHIDLHLARAEDPGFPALGSAPPRAAAAASHTGTAVSKSVFVQGAALQPGRWFVTPVNRSAVAVDISLAASIEYQGSAPALPFGAYYNPQRSGSGIYLYRVQAANLWGIAWYTYLEDGSPVWYLGVATAPVGNAGSWTVPLDRYSWNGDRTRSQRIGEATLTWRGGSTLQFSWNLSGESGSEPMQALVQPACASLGGSVVRASGLWYSPTRSGFGYSVLNSQPTESFAAYLYDGLGLPRWLLAAGGPFAGSSASFTALQFQGTCPLCAYAGATPSTVGTLTRSYSGGAISSIGVDASFLAPLSGDWSESHPTVPIADLIDCP